MSLQHAAKYLADQGRGKDTMLVHMTPREVGSLQTLARANGGSLSINPNTGLPEAGFLSAILPMAIGAGLTAMGVPAPVAGMMVGGVQTARTGSLMKGISAGLGAYGGAGIGAGLMGAGQSALASQAAGEAFNPAFMATVGEGATAGVTPNVMGMEQLQAAYPEATFAELDKAQQAQNAMRNAALEQQTVANVLKPQVYAAPEFSSMDKLKAGLSATTNNLSSAGNFLKDNAKYAMAAASPLLMDLASTQGNVPTASSGPNPYRYRYERGEADPFPTASRTGIQQSYFPNARYVPYAGGGAVEAMSNANAIGANTGFPMADIQRGAYATPYQQPISQNVVTGASDTRVDPYTGTERLAEGGMTQENPLLASPYKKENPFVDQMGPWQGSGGSSPSATGSSSTGQGISGMATDIGLGLMSLSDAVPGISTAIAGMIGNAIAGQQADAMGEANAALGTIASEGQAVPGIASISDSEGNVSSISTAESIAAVDAAMGLADAVAAAVAGSEGDAGASGAGVGGGDGGGGGGGDGGGGAGGDSGSAGAGGDGGGGGGDGGGEAAGGLLRRKYATGGLSDLGSYSDGGRLLRGPGDGVSDSIPAIIGRRQPARLADGEFVVPARIVSELGNGSTEAGARKLYAMLDRVQKARGKTTGKGKVAKNTRADKYLPA